MRVKITGRRMEITDALKQHIEQRLERVSTHFDIVIDADVVLSVEKRDHLAEITVHGNGITLLGKDKSTDMYATIDRVVDKLEKQIRRHKEKHLSQGKRARTPVREIAPEELPEPNEAPRNGGAAPAHDEMLRETFSMKPISIEEAARELELSKEPFLVFSNAETQQVNVLYPTSEGRVCLLEPQF